MSIKDIGKYHQNKIRRQALKDPVGSYFFGGFDLLPKEKQDEVLNYFKCRIIYDSKKGYTPLEFASVRRPFIPPV